MATIELRAPSDVAQDIAEVQALLGSHPNLGATLYRSFIATLNENLMASALVTFLVASAVGVFMARRIVRPIQAMVQASQRIAAGDYHHRVHMLGGDELGTLARAFNQMAEALERTEQRRLALIGDVAHELRTPLSSIRSVVEGLADGVLPAELSTFLDIQREVTRLQRLVHDLEELSRAEAGQIPLNLRKIAPLDLIQAATQRLQFQFEDKGIGLHIHIPSDLPYVVADRDRIIQVLLNLLGNALQYTPTGGQVTVRAENTGQEIVFTVQDTGIGIPAEHLPHVFERFYRVDKSRSRAGGGSGIGLTIAKHLVEACGGRIWIISPGPGQGTLVAFTLPLAAATL
jgi:signal transduction histidine kinase